MISIDLSGKCAFVTGASQGIGRACAEWLARAGASIALVARSEENLREVAAGIVAGGGRAEALPADLTESGRPASMVAEGRCPARWTRHRCERRRGEPALGPDRCIQR